MTNRKKHCSATRPSAFAFWPKTPQNPLGASVHVNKWIPWWVTSLPDSVRQENSLTGNFEVLGFSVSVTFWSPCCFFKFLVTFFLPIRFCLPPFGSQGDVSTLLRIFVTTLVGVFKWRSTGCPRRGCIS